MKKIYFATTNQGKLKEAESILGIKVIGTPLEIEEIQSLEAVKVATQKAKDYFKILKKPIFAEDMALSFSALKGFPGTYIKDFLDTFGNKGLVELIKGNKDRTVRPCEFREDHPCEQDMPGLAWRRSGNCFFNTARDKGNTGEGKGHDEAQGEIPYIQPC